MIVAGISGGSGGCAPCVGAVQPSASIVPLTTSLSLVKSTSTVVGWPGVPSPLPAVMSFAVESVVPLK